MDEIRQIEERYESMSFEKILDEFYELGYQKGLKDGARNAIRKQS